MYNLNCTHCNLKTTYEMTTGLKPFPTFHIITLEILMLSRGTFQQVQTRRIRLSFVECAYLDLGDICFIILEVQNGFCKRKGWHPSSKQQLWHILGFHFY